MALAKMELGGGRKGKVGEGNLLPLNLPLAM